MVKRRLISTFGSQNDADAGPSAAVVGQPVHFAPKTANTTDNSAGDNLSPPENVSARMYYDGVRLSDPRGFRAAPQPDIIED